MQESVNKFLGKTITELLEHGIEVNLSNKDHVIIRHCDSKVNGYFIDRPTWSFGVAAGHTIEEWLPVYVHEFNHFRQWREEDPVYLEAFIDGVEAFDYIDGWVNGTRDFSEKQVDFYVARAREMEADCERRTYHMIQEYDLPINLDTFAQKANSYIHFYNYIARNKTWYKLGNEPYRTPEVYKNMNITIDDDFATVNFYYMGLFSKHCF